MANDRLVLSALPITGGGRKGLAEDLDCIPRHLQLVLEFIPLWLSMHWFHLVSSLQPLPGLLDEKPCSTHLRLDGRTLPLSSRGAEEQGVLAGWLVLTSTLSFLSI